MHCHTHTFASRFTWLPRVTRQTDALLFLRASSSHRICTISINKTEKFMSSLSMYRSVVQYYACRCMLQLHAYGIWCCCAFIRLCMPDFMTCNGFTVLTVWETERKKGIYAIYCTEAQGPSAICRHRSRANSSRSTERSYPLQLEIILQIITQQPVPSFHAVLIKSIVLHAKEGSTLLTRTRAMVHCECYWWILPVPGEIMRSSFDIGVAMMDNKKALFLTFPRFKAYWSQF